MTSAPAIGFEYRPSHWLPRLLWAMSVLALLAIAATGFPVWLKLLLALVVAAAVFHAVRHWQGDSVRAAGWGSDGNWSLRLASGDDAPATLASFRLLGDFILLRLQAPTHGRQVLLLAPDNSDADIRRRLRMRLATVQLDQATPRI